MGGYPVVLLYIVVSISAFCLFRPPAQSLSPLAPFLVVTAA